KKRKENMKNKKTVNKLWGTAFKHAPQEQAVLFAAGRDVKGLPPADEVLIPYEITASKAYAHALYEQKIITKTECSKLLVGLKQLNKLYQQGKFTLDPSKEDVHSNVESWLVNKLGMDVAGKIHSGRSRSDQGVVDVLLYMKEANLMMQKEVQLLIKTLTYLAKKNAHVLLPAYTHHQHATVTTWGNMLHSYAEAFKKDLKKLQIWHQLEEISPLGSAAAYGSTYPIDKNKINKHLQLNQVFNNEIQVMTFKGDAETLMVFNLTMLMNHLSSLAQTLIVFSTKEFNFIQISDEYSTGSSIMPQKKNPDPLEVMKAKASMCHGYLMSLLSLTKATFVGYNRDHQWVKYLVMDAIEEVALAPKIMVGVLNTMKVNQEIMASWTQKGFILAQAVMEGLAMEFQLPMRLAKLVIEATVKKCDEKTGFQLSVLNQVLTEYQLMISVSKAQFGSWTDPLLIAQKQMKKKL
ncbi:argininosuccinate lyase, partial [Patescibacteria group bacterium]|nr:argininosuccinate lyase [Patescibacteria group bacterium]